MREMKDSGIEWIGEIPADWELSKIGAVYEERNEKVSDVDFQPLSITKQGVVPQLETAAKTNDGENRKLIRKNDFVINSRSDRRGSCGISEYDGSCSLINTVLKPRRNMCNAYYSFVFRSERFADEFYRWGNGIVDDLWSTKWSNMKRIYIPAPSLQEQRCIADYLDRKCSQIDAIIARQQEVIEKLKAYKLSVITEAVTKGLNPDVPMKDSGVEWIGEIPEHWEMIKTRYTVKDIGDIDHYMPESVAVGIPYLMTGDLKDFASEIDFDSCKQVTTDDYLKLSKKIKVEKGDLIFARYATIGTVCLVDVDRDFLVSYSCVIVKADPSLIHTKFLMYCYKSTAFLEEIAKYSNSNTQSNIGKDSMYKAKICIPPLNEQQEIIQYLDKACSGVELLLKSKQAVIDKLTEYKKSLIYEVVTGKKEV